MSDFADVREFLAVPRVTDLALAPDDSRLCITVSALNDESNERVDSLWWVDPTGEGRSRRLTWSTKGERAPVFAGDGSLLFLSNRDGDDETPAALWRLPVDGGEAHKVFECPGGVVTVASARRDTGVVASCRMLEADELDRSADKGSRRQARKDAKVTAILHEESPVRYWDHDLGPDDPHLLALPLSRDSRVDPKRVRDLTPGPGWSLERQPFVLTPDGGTVVAGWSVVDEPGFRRSQLVAIDTATGERRVVADEPYVFFTDPAVSWDGRFVVCVRLVDSTYDDPPTAGLWLHDLEADSGTELAPGLDLWPGQPVFSPDGTTVFFTADENGHRPVFRTDVATGNVTRVTRSGHYTHLAVTADGTSLFALRDTVDEPPAPVRLDARATDGAPVPLDAPGRVTTPGWLEEVSVTVADGATVRSWLVMPDGADAEHQAPLLLWVHGGPHSSWNSWSWRWNPWLMAAQGYAVLLPDPALSTGYGASMMTRGWGQWGGTPYTDLMAATDAVVSRPDIDAERTAAMGGSYGGYMANWIAGHTDRFRCIVTHASVWSFDQFHATTDAPASWAREFGLPDLAPERYAEWSPHRFADRISTPMLVIHGDKDYRVPVGEGLRLWWDLQRRGIDSKYLYFPDEGHWVLGPGNARIWYETVLSWLAVHVLGESWRRPELL